MTSAYRLGRRGLVALQQELSQRDVAVIKDVQRFRLMSGQQLTSLHFAATSSGARSARRVLARLTHHSLLIRLKRRVGGVRAGSDGFVYAIGPVGDRLLGGEQPRRRVREVSDGFLLHTLAVADVYVALKTAEHEGQLKLLSIETEPTSWRRVSAVYGSDWLKPDLITVVLRDGQEVHSFVEVDLGTEHRAALTRKLTAYEQALRSGEEERRRGLFPQVVWLVPDDQRAKVIRRWVHESGCTPGLHRADRQSNVTTALSMGAVSRSEQQPDLAADGCPIKQLTEGGDHE